MTPDERDLRHLFATTADEERAAAAPLDVATLLSLAHRRRTVHAATYSAVGLGVVAAVGLGAVSADGLWRDDVVPPPATRTPTERPEPTDEPRSTPSETPTATPTEAAWTPNWELCGVPADDVWAHDLEGADAGEVWWLASAWPWEMSVSPEAGFTLTLSAEQGESGTARGSIAVRLVDVVAIAIDADGLSTDGEVVGVAAVPLGEPSSGVVDGTSGLPLAPVEMAMVSCSASPLAGGNGAVDTPLPADGLYSLVAMAEITPEGQAPITSVSAVGTLGELPPAPPVEPWAGYPPEPMAPVHYLTAGAPLRLGPPAMQNQESSPGGGCGGWGGRSAPDHAAAVQLAGSAFLQDGELVGRMTLTNRTAAPLKQSFVIAPYILVSRNGQNLGWAQVLDGVASLIPPGPFPEGQPYDVGVWPAGQSYDLEASLGRTNCRGEAWDAGTYDVTVIGFLMAPSLTGSRNMTSLEEGPFTVEVG